MLGKLKVALGALLVIGALGAIAAPSASATASCSLSASAFVPVNPINYVAAQMTMSGCTDTKAVKWSQVSALQGNACLGQPAGDCPQVHYEELILGGTSNCHLPNFATRQDWTCSNSTGTIPSASLYQYVTRSNIGFAGSCDYISTIVGYQLQSYSTGSWSNLFYIAFPYQYICHA